MKTWRERIVEARERGAFTGDDNRTWQSPSTCLVGEAAARFGVAYEGIDRLIDEGVWANGQKMIYSALLTNNFGELDRLLDKIEDYALQLKREGLG